MFGRRVLTGGHRVAGLWEARHNLLKIRGLKITGHFVGESVQRIGSKFPSLARLTRRFFLTLEVHTDKVLFSALRSIL